MKTAYELRQRQAHEDQPLDTIGLMPGWVETICLLVEHGPIDDGDFPSKTARNSLIEYGYAQYVIVNSVPVGCVATYKGGSLYCQLFDKYPSLNDALDFHKANPEFLRELWQKQRNEVHNPTIGAAHQIRS